MGLLPSKGCGLLPLGERGALWYGSIDPEIEIYEISCESSVKQIYIYYIYIYFFYFFLFFFLECRLYNFLSPFKVLSTRKWKETFKYMPNDDDFLFNVPFNIS